MKTINTNSNEEVQILLAPVDWMWRISSGYTNQRSSDVRKYRSDLTSKKLYLIETIIHGLNLSWTSVRNVHKNTDNRLSNEADVPHFLYFIQRQIILFVTQWFHKLHIWDLLYCWDLKVLQMRFWPQLYLYLLGLKNSITSVHDLVLLSQICQSPQHL